MFFLLCLVFAQPQGTFPRSNIVNRARKSATVLAIEKVRPSVVSITTESVEQNPFSLLYGTGVSSSDGSGVVISKTGIVLTNAHVVEQASKISVSFANGKSYYADIVGLSSDLDLAVLQIQEKGSFPAILIGHSDTLMLGESVIAIGNPFGLGHTVTTGVVSTLSRSIETKRRVYQDFIQTDASINPGNSGGPLINLSGELIGINTAIRANAEGIGFAIPIDRAIHAAEDLLHYGDIRRPWFAISLYDVQFRSGRTAPQVGVVYSSKNLLRKGDILLSINNRELQSVDDFNTYLAGRDQKASVEMKIWRQGKEKSLRIRPHSFQSTVLLTSLKKKLGISLSELQIQRISPRGLLYRYGLQSGDRIFSVNGILVRDVPSLQKNILRTIKEHKSSLVLGIQRRRARGQVEIELQ